MVTTAVHIEVAVDLSASTFIHVFRRFLCSTGFRTQFLRTDNGTNFVGGINLLKSEVNTALQEVHDSNDLQKQMRSWEVQWEFGQPEVSHHGGVYKRQMRTIRKGLNNFSDLPSPKKPSETNSSPAANGRIYYKLPAVDQGERRRWPATIKTN